MLGEADLKTRSAIAEELKLIIQRALGLKGLSALSQIKANGMGLYSLAWTSH